MKLRLIKYIALLVALLSVFTLFVGCLDVDEFIIDLGFYNDKKRVNDRVDVMLRECAGVTCRSDEKQVSVYKGERVTFEITLDTNYIYIGNSANAEYNPTSGKIIIDSVKAPMTVDVYAAAKDELYYVEYYIYDALTGEVCEEVTVNFASGNDWERKAHQISLEAELGSEYTVVCWSLGSKYHIGHTENATVLAVGDTLDFAVENRGITKIYLNVVTTSNYKPDMSPSPNV